MTFINNEVVQLKLRKVMSFDLFWWWGYYKRRKGKISGGKLKWVKNIIISSYSIYSNSVYLMCGKEREMWGDRSSEIHDPDAHYTFGL